MKIITIRVQEDFFTIEESISMLEYEAFLLPGERLRDITNYLITRLDKEKAEHGS